MTDLEQRGLADLTAFWQMSPAERIALATVAGALEVDCAIEIGTAQGGSLAAITKYAALTYSLELLPESSERLRARIPNAAFRVGDSRSTIPEVLREISSAGRHLDLVLVDGDHSRAGVRADIDAVLQYVPRRPMAMLMHDSFNPDCRFGMRDVAWSDYPHVHAVDLDFVAGNTIPQPDGRFEMWAGLALAVLMPAPRQRVLTIAARNEALFEQTFPHSAHAAAFSDATPGRITTAPAESWYQAFASAGEDRLQRFLEGIHRGGDPEPADFAPIRARLAPLVAQWRSRAARVAVYGAGTHTKALLGLVPEVFPLVSCFIDRQGSGSFLGRPRVSPSAFSADSAEVVLYSSPQHEAAMFASLSSQPVEHVRLYA
jgi:hypothetical protein